MEKRTLEVQDLWAVKSLVYQKTTPSKKRKLGTNLYMQDDDQDEDKEGGSDMAAYFGRMRIYFMCLAIVGAAPRQGAPGSPEDLGTDATDYIQVPWDLLLKYQARAEKAAGGAPLQSRMLAVTGLDVEERGQWAHRFATETTKTLGKIIKELMIEREALWVLGASGSRASAVPEPLVPPRGSAPGGVIPAATSKIVTQLRDGSPLCAAFQRGQCTFSGRQCDNGFHRCGHLVKGGRACGSFGHAGKDCQVKNRLWKRGGSPSAAAPGHQLHDDDTPNSIQQFMDELSKLPNLKVDEMATSGPVMLDLFSGENAPLAQAFNWCGWRVVTPIDIAIDVDFDVTRPAVRRAILHVLPEVSLLSAAFSCSTKSRAREKQPGPKPLRSDAHPRGLPTLMGPQLQRVEDDNLMSDFSLACQAWLNSQGAGCLRENPINSLHWCDPVELWLCQQDDWYDLCYDACVFMGARKKGQRIRHNITEFNLLPDLTCGHIHHANEWSRQGENFPTYEEAEYTPSLVFTLAVCATAWATKQGMRIEPIPRLPPIQSTGDVRPLLNLDPAFLRKDLMVVTALHLGLRDKEMRRLGVPPRLEASEVHALHRDLPPSHVYIGAGHFSHRWQVSHWSNPFLAGKDGTHFEVVVYYQRWLADQPHLDLEELRSKTLVCDCPRNRLCHGDVLAAAVWASDPDVPVAQTLNTQSAGSSSRLRQILLMASGSRIVRSMPIQVCQEELIGTFKSLCPFKDWSTFKFPMIEDLINQPVFLRFASWRREHGFWDGMPAGPRKVGLEERAYFRMSVGTQTGAASSGKAAPPLVPFGLGPDGHFQFASMVQSVGTPFEIEPIVDDDLAFASFTSAASGLDIRKIRTHWIPLDDLWTTAMEDAKRICDRLRPGEFDDAIMEAGAKDENLGFCGPRMSWEELCAFDRPFRLIRRFCIQQPGGKLRVIDDAADGGQSALSSDGNKLDLCTAIQPGLHVRLLWRDFIARDPRWFDDDGFESGGEDLPHAYRHVPMIPSESWACIVDTMTGSLSRVLFVDTLGCSLGSPLQSHLSIDSPGSCKRVSDA